MRVKNPHFGGISGQIQDVNGARVAGAQVRAMKTGEQGFGATVTADENGAYKFRGLTAGEYIVSAAPAKREPAAKGTPNVEGVLGDTFYPSTIDRRLAAQGRPPQGAPRRIGSQAVALHWQWPLELV